MGLLLLFFKIIIKIFCKPEKTQEYQRSAGMYTGLVFLIDLLFKIIGCFFLDNNVL